MPVMSATAERIELELDGVYMTGVEPAAPDPRRPPLVLIHGGCHASWCWEPWLPLLAAAGWRAYAFDWYHHGRSQTLSPESFVGRSIADVTEEIDVVVRHLGATPALIGHSLGGLAAQKYAERAETAALVLLTPGVPAEVGCAPVELPLPIPRDEPFPPPPREAARDMFFHGVPEHEVQRMYPLLCPESPRAVEEVTRHTLHVDRTRVSSPILVLGAEHDALTPAPLVRRLADHYCADYLYLRGRGHGALYEPGWEATAARVESWLRRVCAA